MGDKEKIQIQHKSGTAEYNDNLKFLVAISYSPESVRLLHWAKNHSTTRSANLQAVYVETSRKLSPGEEEQLNKNFHLAKTLGINIRIITHNDVAKAIVDFAHKESKSQIIVGKPRAKCIFYFLRLSFFINKLVGYSGKIDVLIVGPENYVPDRFHARILAPSFTSDFVQYLTTGFSVIITAIVCYLFRDSISYHVISFILLFLVSILAIFYGTGPILLAAILSAVILDFFFIPPQFTLHIGSLEDVFTFLMFFIIALLNGILTSRVRRQETRIRIREERTHALYQLTRELSSVIGIEEVHNVALKYIQKYFKMNSFIILKTEENLSDNEIWPKTSLSGNDFSIAERAFKNSRRAGKYSESHDASAYTFYPLIGNISNIGVIVVEQTKIFTEGEEQFWEAGISQIAGKYEREILRNVARKADVLTESDKLYRTLFNTISHELRIPVATILGASDTLTAQNYPEETRKKLYSEISIASLRLNRLIENLLNMSRLESGHITLRPDWCDVNDLANHVQEMLSTELKAYKFIYDIPSNMPLVKLDFGLMEHVLYNLILNAIQHTPQNNSIELNFNYENGFLIIEVMDRGTGFYEKDLDNVFDKFFRGQHARTGGTGLGLSIVKGFVEAHQGSIVVENRENGGAKFIIKIPSEASDINS